MCIDRSLSCIERWLFFKKTDLPSTVFIHSHFLSTYRRRRRRGERGVGTGMGIRRSSDTRLRRYTYLLPPTYRRRRAFYDSYDHICTAGLPSPDSATSIAIYVAPARTPELLSPYNILLLLLLLLLLFRPSRLLLPVRSLPD